MINLAVLLAFSGEFGRAGEFMARCFSNALRKQLNGGEGYGPKEDVLHGDGTCGGTEVRPCKRKVYIVSS